MNGNWGLPSVAGTNTLPVEASPTTDEYNVEVVVRRLTVDTLVTAEDTTVATVENEDVKTAFVSVLTGIEPVRPVAVNTEMTLPDGAPLTVAARGLSPGTMLIGPDCAKTEFGLFTSVHRNTALLLPSAVISEVGRYIAGKLCEKMSCKLWTETRISELSSRCFTLRCNEGEN